MEEDLQWKMTFGGRRPLMEDDIRWRTTLDRRGPSFHAFTMETSDILGFNKLSGALI